MKLPIFVNNEEITVLIAIAHDCGKRPSEVGGIVGDDYTAYCFDSACLYIKKQIADGKKPAWKKQEPHLQRNYSKFSDYILDLKKSTVFKNLPK